MTDISFFVCVYKENGEPIAHAISLTNDFAETVGEQNKKVESLKEQKAEQSESFRSIYDSYIVSMLSYIDVLPFVASISPMLSYTINSEGVREFLREKSINSLETNSKNIFEIPLNLYPDFKDISGSAEKAADVGRQIPKMLIIGIVSAYEHHASRMIRNILIKNPSRLESSEKTVSIREVFEAKDINIFKEIVLDKEIDIVMRNSFEDQISWIERSVGIKSEIKAEYGDWPRLVEIFERRNLFTHTNGVVNDKYLKKAEKLNFKGSQKLKRADELQAGPKYFKQSLEIICEFGVKLIQVCWRKVDPDSSEEADNLLSDFGFDLIERGYYSLAIKIFEFFVDLKGSKNEERRLRSIVNLANAHKLNGDDKKAAKILDQEDFSVVNDTFKICIASVKGEIDDVVMLLRKMGTGCEFGERAYEDWPVFFHVRDDERFKDAFNDVFGRQYVPSPKRRRGVLDAVSRGKRSEGPQVQAGSVPEEIKLSGPSSTL